MTSKKSTATKGAMWIHDYDVVGGLYTDTVHVQELPSYSRLLGADGQPLRYEKHPVGFDMRPQKRKLP